MGNYKNVFAFDIGIASTGSAVSDGTNITYMGTHVFTLTSRMIYTSKIEKPKKHDK